MVDSAGNKTTVPEWINTLYIQNSLQTNSLLKKAVIHECNITPGTAAGENYSSLLLRANLVLQRDDNQEKERLDILIKTWPLGARRQSGESCGTFAKESQMYSVILPQLDRLLKRAFPEHEKLHAECYCHQGPPNDVIILEDLTQSGFRLADRFGGLDLDHITIALRSLGKMHAASVVLVDQNPDLKIPFYGNLWEPKLEHVISKVFNESFTAFVSEIITWDDIPDKNNLITKLKEVQATALKKQYQTWARDETKMNVILHGDMWINNIMFKYTDQKLANLKFVDFQLTSYNSPAMDLNYFIFTSPKDELRLSHLDFMLQVYHDSFIETINRLDFQLEVPFSFEDLQKDFFHHLFHGFCTAVVIYPITIVSPMNAQDVSEDSASEAKKSLYDNEIFRKTVKQLLPFFKKHGIL